jgi:hypothetical protein
VDECKPLLSVRRSLTGLTTDAHTGLTTYAGAAAQHPEGRVLLLEFANCVLLNTYSTNNGEAVQIDPIKPTLKAPGTKRLKLEHGEAPSHFGFKINLRRYTAGGTATPSPGAASGTTRLSTSCSARAAGAYIRSHFGSA